MSSVGLVRTGQSDQRARDGEQAQDVSALHVVIITLDEWWGVRSHVGLGRLFINEQPFQLGKGDSQQAGDLGPLVWLWCGTAALPTVLLSPAA